MLRATATRVRSSTQAAPGIGGIALVGCAAKSGLSVPVRT